MKSKWLLLFVWLAFGCYIQSSPTQFGQNKNPSGGGFTPIDISGLQLWLSDTGSDPSVWPDLSGRGCDATQATSAAQPTIVTGALGGHQVRRFDGVDDRVATTHSFTVGTLIAVVHGGDAALQGLASGEAGTDQRLGLLYPDAATWYAGDGNDTVAITRVNGIITSVHDSGAGEIVAGSSASPAPLVAIYVGASGNQWWWHGDIAEVIIYDTVLGSTDRHKVEAYLGTKYGITIP